MKKRLLLLSFILPLLFLAASFYGCVLEPAAEALAENTENTIETNARAAARPVALEDALAEMYSLMGEIEALEGTRSGNGTADGYSGRRNIRSAELLGAKELGSAATRSGDPILDSLLYIVNFVEGGFAVLGADESLAPVIALAAAGNLAISDFTSTQTTDNAYTLEDLWVEEDQDYMLGGIQPEKGSTFVAGMILDYALNGNNPGGLGISDGGGNDPGSDDGGEGPATPVLPPAGGGYTGPTYTFHYTEWVVQEGSTKRRLLNDNIRWHQNSPFNDLCPPYKDERASAGCIAIAVMQIMAHHQFPVTEDVFYHGWYPDVTWDDLIAAPLDPTKADDESLDVRFAAADIAYHVGKGVNMWYNFPFSNGASFATPNQAAKYLTRQGYKAKRHKGYEEEKVRTSIMGGFPAIVGGMSNEKAETRSSGKEKGGHAWVVDGWMERLRTMIRRGSDGSEVVVKTENQRLVHCNWGWSGWYDGYYHSGMFRLTTGPVVEEGNDNGDSDVDNYDSTMRTVIVKR